MSPEIQILSMMAATCLLALLFIATVTDVISHRIPNILLAPALGIALLTGAAGAGMPGVLTSLAGLAIGLAMLLPLYVSGGMGAGDVKLLGVAGAFLGPSGALLAGVATFIAGAVFGLLWITWRRLRPTLAAYSSRYFEQRGNNSRTRSASITDSKANAFAYAPAISAGAAFAIWQQGLLTPILVN